MKVIESISNPLLRYAGFLSPIRMRHRAAIESQKSVAAFISRLLTGCSPANIRRLVIAVCIGISVQTVLSGWALANIGEKVFKAPAAIRLPSVANFDSPAAVSRIADVILVCASISHIDPREVSRSLRSSVFSVAVSSFRDLALKASTTPAAATAKAIAGDDYFHATIAATFPKYGGTSFLPRWFYYRQTSELLTRNVLESPMTTFGVTGTKVRSSSGYGSTAIAFADPRRLLTGNTRREGNNDQLTESLTGNVFEVMSARFHVGMVIAANRRFRQVIFREWGP